MSDQLEAARLARAETSWPVKRLRHISRLVGGGTPSKGEAAFWTGGAVPWASPKDMKTRIVSETEDYITEEAVDGSATTYVEPGSPLIVVRSGILRHTLPVAIAGRRLTLNQDMKAFRLSKEVDGSFLTWWIEGQSSELLLEWRQFGATVESIDTRRMMGARIALPTYDIQKAIAAYLDHEIARTDRLIERRSRFIVLLKEMRLAVVAHAVTRGIDTDVELKETGVDWLGKIPAHWQVVRPTALFTESKERARDGDQLLSATQKYGVIPLSEFEEIEKRQVTLAVVNLEMRKHVEIGDFVISMRSMDGGLERAHAKGCVRSSYSVLKPGPNVEGRFYGALLKSSLYIQALRLTSNFIRDGQDLNFGHFRKVRLPKLDVQEQAAIADHIENETARINSLLTLTERSISLLRARRAALATAAVTGQLDVRAKLPAMTTKPHRSKFRLLVGAEITHRHQGNAKFGRVKLQKELFLAETHVGISELQGNYLREAAGPFDRALIDETERLLELEGFYRVKQSDGVGGAVIYMPLTRAGQHADDLKTLLGRQRVGALRNLIILLSDLDRRQVEAVATLYAVWNDMLMDGQQPDDAAIISGVLTEWHMEKGEKFKDADLRHWLDWMKRNGLVPKGKGPRTAHTMTPDMFA
ncbi:restriction endonuclease subunit S [Mesorhizobium sp. B2-3-13]|uniref:restriction endonuclease subunit S n=1 Tax=Mesorhizobium sp. B2-3-13 TaxID=2589951 RepID=UPI00112A065E|nr:restriction endonuclease subunit S [Mesorhizobium sp. B2-3-13]TPL76250.1 restriction endonuclease subunit S [Mesorhizobium sp. B2-3-13]